MAQQNDVGMSVSRHQALAYGLTTLSSHGALTTGRK